MPVKTVSWRQQSEPPYRRHTTSLQMSLKPQIPRDQMTTPMQSLSPTARVPSLWMARTAKCQKHRKRKVQPANTPQPLLPHRLSSVFTRIIHLLATESLRTKKTTTVTRKRRAKRITWSLRLAVLVILPLTQNLQGTPVQQQLKTRGPRKSTPPKVVT